MFELIIDDEITLHLVQEAFVPAFTQIARKDYQYLAQWLEWPRHCQSEQEFKKFVGESRHKFEEGSAANCAIVYKGVVVGVAGYNVIDRNLGRVEIGYWIASAFQHKGIVTRVCRGLIKYAFDDLKVDKVQISAAVANLSSRAVCERLNMRLEGIITHEERIGEAVLDHAVYGLHRQ